MFLDRRKVIHSRNADIYPLKEPVLVTRQSDHCKSNLTRPRMKEAGLRSSTGYTSVSNTPRDGSGRSLTFFPRRPQTEASPFLKTTAFPSSLLWPVPARPTGLSPVTFISHLSLQTIQRSGADKPLDRPGRKQGTENKFWIYSTHSPRSSMHFLAR
jgi:hypothetical protein